MGSDSVIKGSVPVPSKDFGKKKRTNRLAKLKQTKLDARREQWLSQAKKKGCKEESNGGGGDSIPLCLPPKDEKNQSLRDSEMRSRRDENDVVVEFIKNSQINCVLGGNDSGKDRPGSSSGSCSSGSVCFSGSITEDEEQEEEEDDGCLDDWEAVADALSAEDKRQNPNFDPPEQPESPIGSTHETQKMATEVSVLKPECKRNVPVSEAKGRAWRPDDACRPRSLPNLSKQHSFPMNAERHCGRGSVTWACHSIISQPSSCPICFEDLDLTDSSFLPCSCGFRLCLFCHKRILEVEADDARCPGCRKHYAPVNGDTGINGGASAFRLARSCSMNIRS